MWVDDFRGSCGVRPCSRGVTPQIRDQAASGRIPTHLEQFIAGYPGILNISYSPSAAPKVPKGGRVEEVTRVRRLTRFHSRNLIQTAGTWSVPHSPDWNLFFPSTSGAASIVTANGTPPPIPTPCVSA